MLYGSGGRIFMCRECLLVLNLSSRRQVSRGEISYRFLGGLCEVFVFCFASLDVLGAFKLG